MQKKHYIYYYFPLIIGFLLMGFMIFLNLKFGISYQNLHGYQTVLKSMIILLSITISFYSVFYLLALIIARFNFKKQIKHLQKFQKLLSTVIICALNSSVLSLVVTILMQLCVNYSVSFILYIYYLWFLLVGISLGYYFQIASLMVSFVFISEPIPKKVKRV